MTTVLISVIAGVLAVVVVILVWMLRRDRSAAREAATRRLNQVDGLEVSTVPASRNTPEPSPDVDVSDAEYMATALGLYDKHELAPGVDGLHISDYWSHDDASLCSERMHSPWEDIVVGSMAFLVDLERSDRLEQWIQLRSGDVVTRSPKTGEWIWIIFESPDAPSDRPASIHPRRAPTRSRGQLEDQEKRETA